MILKLLKYISICIYAVSGVLLVLFLVPQTGYRALAVQTGSMRPAIPQGSLVIDQKVAPRSLKIGNVVTYINPYNTKQTITHRIVRTGTKSGLPTFVTKGDANQTPDKEILGGNVVGRVVFHVPFVGEIVNWLRKPFGLILLIFIPGVLIIIDESRRMARKLSEPERKKGEREPLRHTELKMSDDKIDEKGRAALDAVKKNAGPGSSAGMTRGEAGKTKKGRGFDSLGPKILLMLVVPLLMIGTTFSKLSAKATLTNNSISTAAIANHMLINAVFLGPANPNCGDVVINQSNTNTGPGSTNTNSATVTCTIVVINSGGTHVTNTVTIHLNNGGNSSNGNTNGGNIDTGDINVGVDINNNTSTGVTPQWVQLYNPTATAVSLNGWTLTDNSGTSLTIGAVTIPAHGFVLIHAKVGDGLSGAGDRLILKNSTALVRDAISWGTDTTQLNPPISAIPTGHFIIRKFLGIDTDTAADWKLN